MQFQLDIHIPELEPRIQYPAKIALIGSCFTEHITQYLKRVKFPVMENPHGILFNPHSVCQSLQEVMDQRLYTESDLFYYQEYYHSWFHHSDFSALKPDEALHKINTAIQDYHVFLKDADYLFITLGSAFAYYVTEGGFLVGNNHRAPSAWFEKRMLDIPYIQQQLQELLKCLSVFNPKLNIIFTISPVRHHRDGLIENNHSKARLLEAVHHLNEVYYFPAYELLIDVLRDYRFYDADLVHPNYAATQYVWSQFVTHCLHPSCQPLMAEMDQIYKARHHKPKDTRSQAHQQFMQTHYQHCLDLKQQYPFLDLEEELHYFASSNL